jgi:hypothetical protein
LVSEWVTHHKRTERRIVKEPEGTNFGAYNRAPSPGGRRDITQAAPISRFPGVKSSGTNSESSDACLKTRDRVGLDAPELWLASDGRRGSMIIDFGAAVLKAGIREITRSAITSAFNTVAMGSSSGNGV